MVFVSGCQLRPVQVYQIKNKLSDASRDHCWCNTFQRDPSFCLWLELYKVERELVPQLPGWVNVFDHEISWLDNLPS